MKSCREFEHEICMNSVSVYHKMFVVLAISDVNAILAGHLRFCAYCMNSS